MELEDIDQERLDIGVFLAFFLIFLIHFAVWGAYSSQEVFLEFAPQVLPDNY